MWGSEGMRAPDIPISQTDEEYNVVNNTSWYLLNTSIVRRAFLTGIISLNCHTTAEEGAIEEREAESG